ncbi:MAG: hypothetical protein ACJ788_23165 [Ktedonobacteraceae bacterium]
MSHLLAVIDVDVFDDYFLVREMHDQNIVAHGYGFEDDVAKVIDAGLTTGCSCFAVLNMTGIDSGVEFGWCALKSIYALGVVNAGEDTEQHIFTVAGT